MDNLSLIKGLREHDRTTIEYLFEQFFPLIENMVRANGKGSRQEAEDLFMNALEVLYLKVQDEDFKLTCAFSTLLFEICKRQWLKTLKYKKRFVRVTIDSQSELIEEHDLALVLEQSERYQLYREKFKALSEGCREVLSLFLEGVSMKEIAERLGFASEQYARKRKFKCKEKLMELVRKDTRYIELITNDKGRKD
ncbi:MAG: sigma-70 family RNA polymerase sigma factor [Phaeodactylibacter sp.]|nr:sigma-70 family RNA polymerase sigma factor [Phaeodactylibacter sp.]